MNNEPVAWAVWEGSVHDMFFTKEDADELCRLKGGDAKSVPLYAHQYERPHNTVLVPCDKLAEMKAEIETLKKDNKELNAIAQRMAMAESDARKSLQWMKDVEAMGSCAHTELTDEEIDDVWFSYKGDIKDFARAILRKAQEK